MARPQLVLHIGTHKTGTSALQGVFEAQRDRLRGQGVCYPITARAPWPDLPKHCSVYQAAASGDAAQQAAEWRVLLDEFEASQAHTLLISEEGLSEPDPSVSRFFAARAADFDITVVCFLRRQDLYVESLFNQFVRESARREARPLLSFLRAPATRARLDYHTLLERWAALPARIHAIDFDADAVRQAGIVRVFERASGMDLGGVQAPRTNASCDMRLALVLNHLHRQREACEMEPLLRAGRALSQSGWPLQRHLLGSQERARLRNDLSPSNRRLAADFGIEWEWPPLPGEAPLATEAPDTAYLLALAAALSRQ
ncbi:MAG: hypothetical protein HY856_09055 [Burkholderiales bacterium]|nr:hypothetical protein [Burkholderiales bacterium]